MTEVGMTVNESIEWNDQFQNSPSFASDKRNEWNEFASGKYQAIIDDIGPVIPDKPPDGGTTETPFAIIPTFLSFLAVAAVTVRYKRKK